MAAAAGIRASDASRIASEVTAQAEVARRRAFEEMENAYRDGNIFPRTVQIPGNAFNAGHVFTSLFTATAIVGVVLLAKASDELKKMKLYVKDIRDELGAQTTAMIQGWQNEGFGAFIYKFLETEINDCGGEASVGHHAFYIYNPTTSADVVFKQKVRDQPLPASFGGFSSDLEAIFRLMWANRQTLRATMPRDAADAVVFHLLIPAKKTMAVLDRMAIHESIGHLIIKGHKDDGSCYAWFNFVRLPRQVALHDIRNLDTDAADEEKSTRSFAASCIACMACGIGGMACSVLFPPAEPFLASAFVTCWASAAKSGPFDHLRRSIRPAPRVLGPPSNSSTLPSSSFLSPQISSTSHSSSSASSIIGEGARE